MARRAYTPRQTLKVHVTFEPRHGTPDCVAHAYERVVPPGRAARSTTRRH